MSKKKYKKRQHSSTVAAKRQLEQERIAISDLAAYIVERIAY